MTKPITIRRVSVEFLRPGSSHNQLLSPYTQYLAICNDAGAAVVTVPYEQRVFERRLKELRYETGDQSDRMDMLHEIGRDMGRILEAVPGFTGALMNESGREATLVHVRVTLSAAELALLPFELAEVPVGSTASAITILTRPTVSITRHIRTVSSEGLVWPDRPRILFVAGDPETIPFEAHRNALVSAISSFQYPQRDDPKVSAKERREQFGDLLTILVNPTLFEVQRECESAAYTHIHVLTHGDLDVLSNESYGVVLRDENGSSDVVSGERFVTAISRVGHQPAVVTVASCDSGNVGSVVVPGASFAHAIHQAGIPFVVGAQFPLSKDGSVPLTARLYEGLLWGEHPLLVLHRTRAELHARYNTNWHDWASVVVYEALPPALDDQLDLLRYSQARRALNASLERIDTGVAAQRIAIDDFRKLKDAISYAVDRLPLDGQYGVECIGLRATSRKRMAQATFTLGWTAGMAFDGPLSDQYDLLEQARLDYRLAVTRLLVDETRPAQRKARLHWVLVQLVSLSTVLEQDVGPGEWEAARLAAEYYRDHPDHEERAWSHASLAELWLLRLANPSLSDAERSECAENACRHAQELSRFYPGVDDFPVKSTRRQFQRYIDWWGSDRYDPCLSGTQIQCTNFRTRRDIIKDTADRLVSILERRRTGAEIERDDPSTGPADSVRTSASSEPSSTAWTASKAQSASLSGSSKPAAARPSSGRHDDPFFTIEALPAGHGDSLWMEYGHGPTTHRLLIDCGTHATAKTLLARVEQLPASERFLELFVMSHIDSDHIGGALPFFKAVKQGLRFGDVWFNGWRHVSGQLGARQGEMFSTAIQEFELPWNRWRDSKTIMVEHGDLLEHVLPGGMKLTLLSPTLAQLDKLKPVWLRELKRYGLEPGGRVDYSRFLRGTPSTIANVEALKDIDALADSAFAGDSGAPNGTSIAILAEFAGASALLAADAHAPVLVDSIKRLLKQRNTPRLKIDLFKVSHHGSQNNVSSELIQLLDCAQYLISTNGDHFFHPDRQAMARILKYGGAHKTVYFNYNNRLNEVWGHAGLAGVRNRYNCTMSYPPPDQPGVVVTLL